MREERSPWQYHSPFLRNNLDASFRRLNKNGIATARRDGLGSKPTKEDNTKKQIQPNPTPIVAP
jgi:hypothetical protein